MSETDFFSGNGALLTAAAALAAVLAQGRTKEEVARLGAFFDVLGDALSLLALPDQPSR